MNGSYVMALLEITLIQSYYDQQVINRFNYLGSGTPAAVSMSAGLAFAFGLTQDQTPPDHATLFGALLRIQATALTHIEAIVRNMYSTTDFFTIPFVAGITGENSDTATMSPTSAYGFRTNRVRSDVDRGQKRIAGVVESNVGAGGVLVGGALTPLGELATLMAANLTYDDEGNTLTFAPIIVGRKDYVTPSGNRAYKQYPTEAEQLDHIAQGFLWQVYNTVRTQTSRQYGRGA